MMASAVSAWSPASWRTTGVRYQIPDYADKGALDNVVRTLERKTPLVFAGECRLLEKNIGEAICGNGFVLTGGDCAETFEDFSVNRTRDDFMLLMGMAALISHGGGVSVASIGRTAGQFAKPRTELWETPSRRAYQGDMINGISDRSPDPVRMIDAYHQSAQTLNLLRAFRQGGFDEIPTLLTNFDRLSTRMDERVRSRFDEHVASINKSLRFIESTTRMSPSLGRHYTGHECLLLPYEEAMTRRDSTDSRGSWFDTSAHFLWLGERTRRLNASHIEFLRGIHNPIGIKVSASTDVEELRQIVDILNPSHRIGRLSIISRMGPEALPLRLPQIIRALEDQPVLWCCDPMHANTVSTEDGIKTRDVRTIHREIIAFFRTTQECGVRPGGVHLEMTSDDVAECVGDDKGITRDRYRSLCDPRLNVAQAVETAMLISDLLSCRM